MSNQILINYEEVYNKTAEQRQRIQSELAELDAVYRRCQADLQSMDGRAYAEFVEVLSQNRMKAHVTAEVLTNLLQFIALSAKQIEQDEIKLKTMFNATVAKRQPE